MSKKLLDLPKELTDNISSYLNPKQNINLYNTSKSLNNRFKNDKCYIILQNLIRRKIDIPDDLCKNVPIKEFEEFIKEYTIFKTRPVLGQTIEHIISKGYFSLFKYIINHGVNIKVKDGDYDKSVYNHSDLTNKYLKDDPHMLMYYCATHNRLDMIKFLLKKGFNLHANNENGLMGGIDNFSGDKHHKVAKFLISKGAKINDNILRTANRLNKMYLVTGGSLKIRKKI